MEALRQAIKEGLDSGSAEAFDFEEFMADRKARR
jgi:Arc/MetJ-type ribon-helix-helix transcriptional regulator